MHHGYYGADGKQQKNHRQAQIDAIEELLRWGGVRQVRRLLDAGCGVGGSARYLAQKFDAHALGLTLSPVQAKRALRYTREAGLRDQVEIRTGDLMQANVEEIGRFDLVWSMESAEHIEAKAALAQLFYELLVPGGQLLMATWCIRADHPQLRAEEVRLLDRLYRWYHLPQMVSIATFQDHLEAAGFQHVQTDDWSDAVAPFWKAVLQSALRPANWPGLFRSGKDTLLGAWAMQYMIRGYQLGLIKYGIFRAEKPTT